MTGESTKDIRATANTSKIPNPLATLTMMSYHLTRDDIMDALKEQLYLLDSALTQFSNDYVSTNFKNKMIGDPVQNSMVNSEIEAKRIATIIRVLVHDTTQSKSIFKQLDIKDYIQYLNTASPNDGRLHSMTGMKGVIGLKSDSYFGLIAKINTGNILIAVPLYKQHLIEWYDSYSRKKFDEWWNMEIYNSGTDKCSRKDIILLIANKDGGAHLDNIQPISFRMLREQGLSLNIDGKQTKLEKDVTLAMVAQIGWELLNSVNDNDIS